MAATDAEPVEEFEERLANLRAVTDTALTRLDLDDLLGELLTRVRDVIAADTAAVLLLDESTQELVARAACGIEEEVRQGVRIPLGRGFAGRIAATRGPVHLERVDATTVANPLLYERGIRAMLGVPMLHGDRVLGVLHVGRLEDRVFTAEDASLLQVVADRVAGAVVTRQFALEQAAATALERSLLPGRLPDTPGLDMAARYVPAQSRNIGGDWYDVFRLPSGQLWVVLGDVAGHGLPAAVVMGRVRSALRAYALLDESPERVLELVDRKVRHFEIGTIATVLVAVSEPPFEQVRLATAGHPPPVIAVPGAPVVIPRLEVGPPLGTGFEGPRASTKTDFPDGSVAVLYTDGLIERRGESIDVGLERLRQAVGPGDARAVATEVMHSLVGRSTPEDDIALVVVRRS